MYIYSKHTYIINKDMKYIYYNVIGELISDLILANISRVTFFLSDCLDCVNVILVLALTSTRYVLDIC